MKKPNAKRIFLIIFLLLILPLFSAWILVAQPTLTNNTPSHLVLDSSRLNYRRIITRGIIPIRKISIFVRNIYRPISKRPVQIRPYRNSPFGEKHIKM